MLVAFITSTFIPLMNVLCHNTCNHVPLIYVYQSMNAWHFTGGIMNIFLELNGKFKKIMTLNIYLLLSGFIRLQLVLNQLYKALDKRRSASEVSLNWSHRSEHLKYDF